MPKSEWARVGVIASLKDRKDYPDGESITELVRLADTAGIEVASCVTQSRPAPDPWSYFGKGKIEELRATCEAAGADVLIVNDDLSAAQEQTLSEFLGIEVLDRTALILRIFASNARTREAKLQVELASLTHKLTRLRGKGEYMSRTGGGIGTRGPGEQELEVKRRLIRDRIRRIEEEIEEVDRHRALHRERRKRTGIPSVALAGYTNAGKSTLFRKLTGRDVLIQDKLFSTLDPRTAVWSPKEGVQVLLVDTVGFIRNLPHHLVAAFRSTLDASLDADLILHVVDVSSPSWQAQYQAVMEVLEGLGKTGTPTITCFNKIDKASGVHLDALLRRYAPAAAISAVTGQGLDDLAACVSAALTADREEICFSVPYSRPEVLSEIYRRGSVVGKEYGPDCIRVTCRLEPKDAASIGKKLRESDPVASRETAGIPG